jgi:hypothetical protein
VGRGGAAPYIALLQARFAPARAATLHDTHSVRVVQRAQRQDVPTRVHVSSAMHFKPASPSGRMLKATDMLALLLSEMSGPEWLTHKRRCFGSSSALPPRQQRLHGNRVLYSRCHGKSRKFTDITALESREYDRGDPLH